MLWWKSEQTEKNLRVLQKTKLKMPQQRKNCHGWVEKEMNVKTAKLMIKNKEMTSFYAKVVGVCGSEGGKSDSLGSACQIMWIYSFSKSVDWIEGWSLEFSLTKLLFFHKFLNRQPSLNKIIKFHVKNSKPIKAFVKFWQHFMLQI
jgi:hypothetical protein